MAIVPLSKVTICGLAGEKAGVLEQLQSLGCLHIVPLAKNVVGTEAAVVSTEAHAAIKYLESCSVQRPIAPRREGFEFQAVVAEATAIQRQEAELRDELDATIKAIDTTTPWGEFDLPTPDRLGGQRLWFYAIPTDRLDDLRNHPYIWQLVRRDAEHALVVVVSPDEPTIAPGVPIELDPRPLSQLKMRAAQLEATLSDLELRRAGLTRWIPWMRQSMAAADDRASLSRAMQQTLDDGPIFAFQAWAPRPTLPALQTFAQRRNLVLSIEPPSDQDEPPTLFQNPKVLAGGEDTVRFYMTPSYRSWDPSVVVLFSFALFFAMILSDAGYAAVLAGIVWIQWNSMGRTSTGSRLRYEFAIVAAFSIAWGVAVGAYFGLPASSLPLLGPVLESLRVEWLDANNTPRMMALSVYIGIAHLLLANAITAWRYWGSWRVFVPIGWMLNILAGFAIGLAYFKKFDADVNISVQKIGLGMLAVGALLVVFFTSPRPLPPRNIAGVFLRILEGLPALMGLSALLGDSLSYLRLFALGLATGKLSATLNDMAAGAVAAMGAIGVLFAIFLFLFGHSLNLVLGVMGGVVHGLRLNFIEFFNWSALDEGYPFAPFSKKVENEWTTST